MKEENVPSSEPARVESLMDESSTRMHDLKIWPAHFKELSEGNRTYDVRKDDRGYRVGDLVRLREWDPSRKTYSGKGMVLRVTWVNRLASIDSKFTGYVGLQLSEPEDEE